MVQLNSIIPELIEYIILWSVYFVLSFQKNHRTLLIFPSGVSWDDMNIPPHTGIFQKISHWLILLHKKIILATSHIIIKKTKVSLWVYWSSHALPVFLHIISPLSTQRTLVQAALTAWVKISPYPTHRVITLPISTDMLCLEDLLHFILIICLPGCPISLLYPWPLKEPIFWCQRECTSSAWVGL